MKIRVLVSEPVNGERRALQSGEEVDLPQPWALELLARHSAEPLEAPKAEAPVQGAEARPGGADAEVRAPVKKPAANRAAPKK